METIGIFFGSDTGNTENVANMIKNQLGKNTAKVFDIAKSSKEDLESFNILFLGIPTWYYGEAQCDWDDFFPTLKNTNLDGKTIALFGCGDQEDYSEYFCDALGIIYNIIVSSNIKIVGYWPNTEYNFESSKGLIDKHTFLGLVIDEDRQPELTNARINKWVKQVTYEISLKNSIIE